MATYLPEIPSDNVYKFLTFSGLFLIVFFTVYPHVKSIELYQVNRDLNNFYLKDSLTWRPELDDKGKPSKWAQKEEADQDTILKLRYQLDSIRNVHFIQGLPEGQPKSLATRSKDPNYRDQQRFLLEFSPRDADNYEHVYQQYVLAKIKEIEEVSDKMDASRIERARLQSVVDDKKKELDIVEGKATVYVFLGWFLFVLGLLLWIYRVQLPTDKILKRDSQRTND